MMDDYRLDWIWEHAMKYDLNLVIKELEEFLPEKAANGLFLSCQMATRFATCKNDDIWALHHLWKYMKTLRRFFEFEKHENPLALDNLPLSGVQLTRFCLSLKLLILMQSVEMSGCDISAPFALHNFGPSEFSDGFHKRNKEDVTEGDQKIYEASRQLALLIIKSPLSGKSNFIFHRLKPNIVRFSKILAPFLQQHTPCTVIEYMYHDIGDDYAHLKDPIFHLLLTTVRGWHRSKLWNHQPDLVEVIRAIRNNLSLHARKTDELYHELWDEIEDNQPNLPHSVCLTTMKSRLPTVSVADQTEVQSVPLVSQPYPDLLSKFHKQKEKFILAINNESPRDDISFPQQVTVVDPHKNKFRHLKSVKLLSSKPPWTIGQLLSIVEESESIVPFNRLEQSQSEPQTSSLRPAQDVRRIVSSFTQDLPIDSSEPTNSILLNLLTRIARVVDNTIDDVGVHDEEMPEAEDSSRDSSCVVVLEHESAPTVPVIELKTESTDSSSYTIVEDSVLGDPNGNEMETSSAKSRSQNRIILRGLYMDWEDEFIVSRP